VGIIKYAKLACLILVIEQYLFAAEASASVSDQTEKNGQEERAWERLEIPDVPSIVYRGYQYKVVHWGKARGLPQNGGYIAVTHLPNGKELALIKIYETKYDPEMEADIQDVFITKLTISGKRILIENERSEWFALDTRDFSVTVLKTQNRVK
jgi:hypothetical protein